MEPFDVLHDADGDAAGAWPQRLAAAYGGGIAFPSPHLYANFVASIDGVVAIDEIPSAGSLISGRNVADRFLMGLLRALADAVLVGAQTLRDTPGHRWTPADVHPESAAEFVGLRELAGRPPEPRLVLLTASGDIDAEHPGLTAETLILTTTNGARHLSGRVPATCEVEALGEGPRIDLRLALEVVRGKGMSVVLSEAGPTVTGQLLELGLLDELFLTLSPVLAGRAPGSERKGLVEGIQLLPEHGGWAGLRSVRRHRDHLFLRYSLR